MFSTPGCQVVPAVNYSISYTVEFLKCQLLFLVLLTGIDPVLQVPQTCVLPLHQSSALEGQDGFEPTPQGFAVPHISHFAIVPLC